MVCRRSTSTRRNQCVAVPTEPAALVIYFDVPSPCLSRSCPNRAFCYREQTLLAVPCPGHLRLRVRRFWPLPVATSGLDSACRLLKDERILVSSISNQRICGCSKKHTSVPWRCAPASTGGCKTSPRYPLMIIPALARFTPQQARWLRAQSPYLATTCTCFGDSGALDNDS